jgi:hypothetical protein
LNPASANFEINEMKWTMMLMLMMTVAVTLVAASPVDESDEENALFAADDDSSDNSDTSAEDDDTDEELTRVARSSDATVRQRERGQGRREGKAKGHKKNGNNTTLILRKSWKSWNFSVSLDSFWKFG